MEWEKMEVEWKGEKRKWNGKETKGGIRGDKTDGGKGGRAQYCLVLSSLHYIRANSSFR